MTVPLVYLITQKLSNKIGAFSAAIIFVFSPTHIYYSQESRSYAFITFLAALSLLLIVRLFHARKELTHFNGRLWSGLWLISILGLYSSYSYLLVVGVQVLFLSLFFFRQSRFWVYLACLSAGLLGVIPFLFSLRKAAAIHADGIALDVGRLAQALLAGEPVRYGFHWPHEWLPPLLILLALIGTVDSIRRYPVDPSATLLVLQVLLPVIALFGVFMPIFDLRLPVVDNKQFNSLQPAFYILVGLGFGYLLTGLKSWFGRLVVVLIFFVIIVGSLNSLTRYWSITKSPEGLAVRHVRQTLQAGDEIISLHYSTDAALDFYLPNMQVYSHPIAEAGSWTLSITDPTYRNPNIPQPDLEPIGLDQIWGSERTWLLSRDGYNIDAVEAIRATCSIIDERAYPPFTVRLLVLCQG